MAHAGVTVSIITPTYNHEKFIGDCISSVLSQDYDSWEMLIVDDGSTDNTFAVASEYALHDSRIRMMRQEHRGMSQLNVTYNAALKRASGEYVAILEGDDYWPTNKLSTQLGMHATRPDVILSHGDTVVVERDGAERRYCRPPQVGETRSTTYLRWLLLRQSCIMPVSVIVRSASLQQIGGFQQHPLLPSVDYVSLLRLAKLPGYFSFIPTTLGCWRQSLNQQTNSWGWREAEAALAIALEEFRSLPTVQGRSLDIDERDIVRANMKKTILPATLRAMRQALVRRAKTEARRCAVRLIKEGSPLQRLEGVSGLLASDLGWNLECVFHAIDASKRIGRR